MFTPSSPCMQTLTNSILKEVPYIEVSERSILDRWIISRVESINKEVFEKFDKFEITPLTRDIEKFVDDLSNWYVRRSRRRFWNQRTIKTNFQHILRFMKF